MKVININSYKNLTVGKCYDILQKSPFNKVPKKEDEWYYVRDMRRIVRDMRRRNEVWYRCDQFDGLQCDQFYGLKNLIQDEIFKII